MPILEKKRFSILEYTNGIYQGDITKSIVREGLGVYLWDSGEFYYGEWVSDSIEGEGILYFPYGGYIKGQFARNKIHGLGVLQFPNGDLYKGEWKKGKLNGNCYKYFVQNDTWLVCEYKEGVFLKQQSKGKGRSTQFDFVEKGLCKLEDLDRKYSVNTHNLGYQYNIVTFPDNGKFIGIMLNGLPNGLGMFHYTDGKIDEGFYKNGLLDGFGRLNFQNGDIYDGMMKEGLFEGFGVWYKKEGNKWVYGVYEGYNCKEKISQGSDQPKLVMEALKAEEHKSSDYYQDKATRCKVFDIPHIIQDNQKVLSEKEINFNKKTKNMSPSPQILKKITKKPQNTTNNTESSTQTSNIRLTVDSSTQTTLNCHCESEEIIKNPNQTHSKLEETQKTLINSTSISSEIEPNEKKRLTKLEIENLFQSVKNMIIGVKDKTTIQPNLIENELKPSLNIQNLKESTDFLIQKLENLKKSSFLKENSLQSSDFNLSRSETFQNLESMGNLNQKASHLIESRLLDSCFSTNQQNTNEYNITKSIDFIEKMLSSQIVANKESKISNIDHINGELNFYDIDTDLFQSNIITSFQKDEIHRNSHNFPMISEDFNEKEGIWDKENRPITDKENRHNEGLLAKYGVGIEKIEEKAEEIFNYSPNNEVLKFNSDNMKKIYY